MNQIPEIKKFILRALARMNGIPVSDEQLTTITRDAIAPQPLMSDVRQAVRDLEYSRMTVSQRSELDDSVTWTLTAKGSHQAAQLG